MDFEGYLQDLRRASFYQDQIAHIERIPPRLAEYGDLECPLHPLLKDRLERLEIRQLFRHQAEAVNAARKGENVAIVTATASGKTLCYNLPVLDKLLSEPHSRAFYLFPTKALAQDQLGKLGEFELFPEIRQATYDGDTPASERRFIKKGANLVLTNPDMLHLGILPYHSTWSGFLANLKYVVVDELHTYRGVFGGHVAHIFRRLRRLCAQYGANPQFICCSATIANPTDLATRLTGIEDFRLVDRNGAPAGEKIFVFWNPPTLDLEKSHRRSPHIEVTSLFTSLVTQGVRNIAFTRARKSAELILRYAREELALKAPELRHRIAAYRSGYTIEERRDIERRLFEGEILGVTATNALELGVDVGGLDAALLTGYPGTIASAWQQAGRAGRSGKPSLAILIAFDNPLDQFFMRHPEHFFGKPHERCAVDPDNKRIVAQHLRCAAYERGLEPHEIVRFGGNAKLVLQNLLETGDLFWRGGRFHYHGTDYPAMKVNIRSASDSIFRILNLANDNRLLGTVEGSIAFKTLHEGAIYLHSGENYEVETLDIEGRCAFVRPVDTDYYTEALEESHIFVLGERKSERLGSAEIRFGEVVVTNQVVAYQTKRLVREAILETVYLDLPEQTFETEAFWITLPQSIMQEFVMEGGDLGGSIHAIEHALIAMTPLLATCDRWDLGGVSHPMHPDTKLPTIFVYDAYPGGIGIAEATYQSLQELLTTTLSMIRACPCTEGCPSCIQSPKCGSGNRPLDKWGAVTLLERLLEAGVAEIKKA